MLDQQTVERLAQRLDEAERSKSLIPAFTREYPDLTIEDAYAIQRAWTKLQLSRGRIVRGHKIGLTSKAMQNAVGISEPDYGVLFADMFYPDASPIPFDRFHAPRIEVELAFVLKTPLKGPDCTLFDVLNATDYVTPALEILETRMHRIDPVTKAAQGDGHDLRQCRECGTGRWWPADSAARFRPALDWCAVVSQRPDRGNRYRRR